MRRTHAAKRPPPRLTFLVTSVALGCGDDPFLVNTRDYLCNAP